MDTDPRPVTPAERGSGFASYLAKRLVAEKGFRPGVPDEAARLGDGADFLLTYADLNLVLACIVDRQTDRGKHLGFSKQELLELGKACLKYTGRINGAKMPVSIVVYEVGNGPATAEDLARLLSVSKSFPGLTKVTIQAHYLDTSQGEVWTSVGVQRFLRRLGMRTWLDRLLVEPLRADVPAAELARALPSARRRPVATFGLLALLVGIFVLEQFAQLGERGTGLLSVGAETLLALGGMNGEAALVRGEWYRVFTAALLHADAFHLGFNLVALGLAGYLLESWVGWAWLTSIFSVGATAGSLLGLVFNAREVVSVGASGAVMALLAGGVVLSLRLPRGAERTGLQLQLLQFLIPSLIPIVSHRGQGHVDFAAHFGGAIAGALLTTGLLKVWPRNVSEPRFSGFMRGVALAFVAAFAVSSVLAKNHYTAYAADAPFSTAGLLMEDAQIPEDVAVAKREVETWGKERPRDPRVHLFRALRLLDEGNPSVAESELRAALAEKQILEGAFGNHKLEGALRSVLAELLVQQGRNDEAKREAAPACQFEAGPATDTLRTLGLCP